MKRLLQRIDDGRFYQGPGRYTGKSTDAFEFPDVRSAVERCIQGDMPAVYYVLKFGDEHYDIRIPCDCARHPPENQKGPPAKDVKTSTVGLDAALAEASPADLEEARHWGHSFNAGGMWMNNEGQGQDRDDLPGTTRLTRTTPADRTGSLN